METFHTTVFSALPRALKELKFRFIKRSLRGALKRRKDADLVAFLRRMKYVTSFYRSFNRVACAFVRIKGQADCNLKLRTLK